MGAAIGKDGQRAVLVTGGAGFIGSHVCDALLKTGARVRCFDDLSTGHRRNVLHLLPHAHFTLIEGDLRRYQDVVEAARGVWAVVHLAALGSVPRSIARPVDSEEVNLLGTLHVLEACRVVRSDRLVYASSSSVYGDSSASPKRESDAGLPLSPYAVTKAMSEVYADLYHRTAGVRTIGLRFFNVFGERQDPQGAYAAAIPRFIDALLKHERPVVHGNGEQTRDFTYVGNAVGAINCALGELNEACFGGVYNVACGEEISVNSLLELLRTEIAKQDPQVHAVAAQHGPSRPGDVQRSLADLTRSRHILNYVPRYSVAQGIQRTIDLLFAEE
jgi:UDP-N-acetylglucosamine/UDP-N-acetylgalactosamine 4-epimerase